MNRTIFFCQVSQKDQGKEGTATVELKTSRKEKPEVGGTCLKKGKKLLQTVGELFIWSYW